jgi:microcystin-dependent protein
MPQPGILKFISLTPALINRGDPITLSWQTFDVSSLKLTYGIDNAPYERTAPGDVPFNGSYSPVPPATHTLTYNLEARDVDNKKVQSFVTITLLQPSPVITSLVASPRIANLADGGKVTLYWRLTNTDNARQLTLTSLDASGKEVHETIDVFQTSKEVTVYKPGGVPFRLRVDGLSDPNYQQGLSITVPTWEDILTLATPPAGTVMAFSGQPDKLDSMPGWLKCDGRNVSRNSYPTLWDAIGAIYGGDGNPDFALPDLRGMFLRGVDEGAGHDPDAAGRMTQKSATREIPAQNFVFFQIPAHVETYYPTAGATVGSWQADQLKNHQHNWDHFFYWRDKDGGNLGVHQPSDSRNLQNNQRAATNNDGGGNETRPANVYVYYMIATGQ